MALCGLCLAFYVHTESFLWRVKTVTENTQPATLLMRASHVYVLYQYCIRCLLSDIYFVPSRSCSRLFYSFSLSLVPTHPHLCTLDKKSMHGKRQEQEHTNYCFSVSVFCVWCLVWFGYRYRASKSS